MASILPNMLDVVRDNNIQHKACSSRNGEYYAICPFCGGKWTLQFNTEKNTFVCNRANNCGKRGGVLQFIMLLTGKSKDQILEEIKANNGVTPSKKKKERHPALSIPQEVLRNMGFYPNPPDFWVRAFKRDPKYALSQLDYIWEEYQDYLNRQKDLKRMVIRLIKSNPDGIHAGFETFKNALYQ